MCARNQAINAVSKVVGQSDYRAWAGACTWLNGVYWVNVKKWCGKTAQIENLYDIGRIPVAPISKEIESNLIFPLLRGRDINRWEGRPSAYQVVPQNPETRTGYTEDWFETNLPKTLEYFRTFESLLLQRSGYRKYLEGEPFYSIYNVGEYTFAPYKVVWPWISTDLVCCVISTTDIGKPIIPEHNASFVALENLEEAHYFCAALNSCPARFVAIASSVGGGGGIASPRVLERIRIPSFQMSNTVHKELARLSDACHKKVAAGISVADLEEQIDELASELWKLSDTEMKAIRESLEILNPPHRRGSRNAGNIREEDDA